MSQNKLQFFLNWKSVHNLFCTFKAIACTTHAWFRSCTHFVPAWLKLVIMGHFFPFLSPLKTWKIKILKKWKCVPKTTIIWGMVPEIWSETDRFFSHFGPIFALLTLYWLWKSKFGKNVKKAWKYYPFTQVYQKWRLCNVWFLRYNTTDSFLSVWVIFYPFTP